MTDTQASVGYYGRTSPLTRASPSGKQKKFYLCPSHTHDLFTTSLVVLLVLLVVLVLVLVVLLLWWCWWCCCR